MRYRSTIKKKYIYIYIFEHGLLELGFAKCTAEPKGLLGLCLDTGMVKGVSLEGVPDYDALYSISGRFSDVTIYTRMLRG